MRPVYLVNMVMKTLISLMFHNYGNTTYQMNSNGLALQNDLQQLWDNKEFYPKNSNLSYENKNAKFLSMDITEAAKSLDLNVHGNRQDVIDVLQKLAEMSITPNLSVSPNKNSSYLFLHFCTTHESYCWVKNENLINNVYNPGGINYQDINDGKPTMNGINNNDFVISVWYALQKTKNILNYLKTLPCNDENRPWVKNQYDNTNFYVISDHGNILKGNKKLFNNIQEYLVKKQVMTSKQKDFLINQYFNSDVSPSFYNSIFMRKTIKYETNEWNTKNNLATFFNQDKLVVNSDFYPIFENDLARSYFEMNRDSVVQNFIFNDTDSWYYDNKNKQIYQMYSKEDKTIELIQEQFINNFLINPLNNEKSNINNRVVPLFGAKWQFKPNSKKFGILYVDKFEPKYPNGIFNLNNFVFGKS